MNKTLREKKIKQLRDEIDATSFFHKVSDYNTHIDKHLNKTDVQMINRVFEETHADTVFENRENAEYFIKEALFMHAPSIIDWQENADNYEPLKLDTKFSKDMYDEKIGRGFLMDEKTNIIREYETEMLRIVLKKQEGTPLGFTLTTAYPNIYATDSITSTNRDLTPIMQQTAKYEEADVIGKAYLNYISNPKHTKKASYKQGIDENDSLMTIQIPVKNSNTCHHIRIKINGVHLMTFDKNHQKQKTKYTDIKERRGFDKSKSLICDLHDPSVEYLFTSDYPDIMQTVNQVETDIQHELQKEEENNEFSF